MQADGKTVVEVATDYALLGLLTLRDRVRPQAETALAALHRMGVKTVMLTGDNARTSAAIARELGIDEFHANLKLEEKVEHIRRLQAAGTIVAMVGDGINDAPARSASSNISSRLSVALPIFTALLILLNLDLHRTNLLGVLKGSTILGQEEQHDIPAVPTRRVVNPTGAGDAYLAGIVRGLVRGEAPEYYGRVASLAAAYAVQVFGPQDHLYTLDEFATEFRLAFGQEFKRYDETQ